MDAPFLSYLDLLRELGTNLDQLSQLAQDKIASVKDNDLMGLDDVLKQEQAMTLNLRGLELRRQKLVDQLSLHNVALSNLSGQYPEGLKSEAKVTVEQLQRSYQLYRSYADQARTTLEVNLHELEKAIEDAGGVPAPTGEVEPPRTMKSDFRA